MKVRFLNLAVTDSNEKKRILERISNVLDHGYIINGPEVSEFENVIKNYCNRQYAVGVNSGTDALYLALRSLGIGPGDEVLTTSLSWVATANAIALTGANPVFLDIKEDLNINESQIQGLINSNTKAIVPVHYTGKICAMEEILSIANEHGIPVIEDAAQAFGAEYKGKKAGEFGKLSCFSMNSMKVFASLGEAGIIVTDDEDLYEKLIMLRYNGTINREVCKEVSLNGRLDTIQAAILLDRFESLETIISKRRANASIYDELLAPLDEYIQRPIENEYQKDIYYTYTIKAKNRDELKAYLEKNGVETKIQHPILMPEQPAFQPSKYESINNAMRLKTEILCLPINEKITKTEIEYIVNKITDFYR